MRLSSLSQVLLLVETVAFPTLYYNTLLVQDLLQVWIHLGLLLHLLQCRSLWH
jgi:hypothetical protein